MNQQGPPPPPPPPPPPHGAQNQQQQGTRGPNLPPGNYDIFVIPPHSSGSGFLYLPSLQVQRNSFLAGVICTLLVGGIWILIEPPLKQLMNTVVANGGTGVVALVLGVGVLGWAAGKTQTESKGGGNTDNKPGGGPQPQPNPGTGTGYTGDSYAHTGANGHAGPPPGAHAPPPGAPPPGAGAGVPPYGAGAGYTGYGTGPQPKPSYQQAKPSDGWQKAREEMRKKEEERKKREELEKKAKEAAEKQRWEQSRQREREQREKEARERVAQERLKRERELKEQREKQEREAREARDREARERAAKERLSSNYKKPTASSFVSDDQYSFRPYDKKPKQATSASSFVSGSEGSWTTSSQSTARTTPPPSHRGPYVNKDPDKVTIRCVFLFSDSLPGKPLAQLISGMGSVTDGLVLRMTTEGLFTDDDVRGVPQREWDIKAWTMKLVESGDIRGKHILRASVRDAENKKYVFVIDESEAWKVAVGLQRLRKGSQVRSMGVSGLSMNEMTSILKWAGL